MSTVPPLTNWSVGELPTSAMLNARIRDAINFLKSPPFCVLRKTSTQATSNTTWTAISWDIEDIDSDGAHSNVTNNTRYTSQTDGWYLVVAQLHWTANATGHREIRIRKNANNSDFYGWNAMYANDGAEAADIQTSAYIFLAVGDYIEVMGWQSSGGSLSTFNDGADCRFEVRWVRTNDGVERALPSPRTWTAGLWSTGHLNVDVRDALAFMLAPPMTVLQKLNGNQAANRHIGNAALYGEVTWDTVVADTHGAFNSSDPERYTAPIDGWYHLIAQLQWSDPGHAGGWDRKQLFRKNGTGQGLSANYYGDPTGYESKSYVTSGHVPLSAGEYVVVHTSGVLSEPELAGYDGNTFFGCRWDIRWVSNL